MDDWDEEPRRPAPLELAMDCARLGGALILTSACGSMLEELDGLMEENSNVLVPGGYYRPKHRATYRKHSKLGANRMVEFLRSCGLPRERIRQADFTNGVNITPADEIGQFFRTLPENSTALVYYCGPVTAEGRFALVWHNNQGEQCVAAVDAEYLVPDWQTLDTDVLIVADASCAAQLWLCPDLRVNGVSSWKSMAPEAESGPPFLTAWLTDSLSDPASPPEGAAFFVPCIAGIKQLPAFGSLFRGALPPVEEVGSLLWELQQQVGASTKKDSRGPCCHELLARGGSLVLMAVLEAYCASCEVTLVLKALWLLHTMVLNAPRERWLGTMPKVVAVALAVSSMRPEVEAEVVASALSLIAACANFCTLSRELCAHESWEEVLLLAGQAVEGAFDEPAAIAGCRVLTQLTTLRVPEREEELWMVDNLRKTLWSEEWNPAMLGEVQLASAEALAFASMRSNRLKQHLLAGLRRGEFGELLRRVGPAPKAQILALLRSVAAVEPQEEAASKLKPELVDTVITHLCENPVDAAIQRMGLGALGVLATAHKPLAERGAEGGAICVAWALSCDVLYGDHLVEQEALFCACALLRTEEGRRHLSAGQAHLGGLAAAAISRALREGPTQSQVPRWGLKAMEKLAKTKDGALLVEPYAEVLVDTIISPHSRAVDAMAGCSAIANLVACSATARERLCRRRVQLVKALQQHVSSAEQAGEDGRAQHRELLSWTSVFLESLGGDWRKLPKPVLVDAEQAPSDEEPYPDSDDSGHFCVHQRFGECMGCKRDLEKKKKKKEELE